MNPTCKIGCKCAGCSPESRRAMQINQRGLERSRRDMIDAAEAWAKAWNRADDSACGQANNALLNAVDRMLEWKEASKKALAHRIRTHEHLR
mgnify:CR=1 FL=1